MTWILFIFILSAQDGTGTRYHVEKIPAVSFTSFMKCNAIAEEYSMEHQVFVPASGPPWVYSYAVCEERRP